MKTIKKNMEHSFNITIAKEYGVLAAVLIRNFQYWISKNKSEKHNFVNGHYWTFNSTAGLCELFPYMSKDQINRQINMLVEKGVLIKGHFSENPNDRRTWIAFSDDAKWISQNYEMDLAISQNGFSESAKCINEYYNDTNNKHTDNKPNTPPIIPQQNGRVGFEFFGTFHNVELKPAELRTLQMEFGEAETQSAIDDLSCKLMDGSTESNAHYATLTYWLANRKKKKLREKESQPKGRDLIGNDDEFITDNTYRQ